MLSPVYKQINKSHKHDRVHSFKNIHFHSSLCTIPSYTISNGWTISRIFELRSNQHIQPYSTCNLFHISAVYVRTKRISITGSMFSICYCHFRVTKYSFRLVPLVYQLVFNTVNIIVVFETIPFQK